MILPWLIKLFALIANRFCAMSSPWVLLIFKVFWESPINNVPRLVTLPCWLSKFCWIKSDASLLALIPPDWLFNSRAFNWIFWASKPPKIVSSKFCRLSITCAWIDKSSAAAIWLPWPLLFNWSVWIWIFFNAWIWPWLFSTPPDCCWAIVRLPWLLICPFWLDNCCALISTSSAEARMPLSFNNCWTWVKLSFPWLSIPPRAPEFWFNKSCWLVSMLNSELDWIKPELLLSRPVFSKIWSAKILPDSLFNVCNWLSKFNFSSDEICPKRLSIPWATTFNPLLANNSPWWLFNAPCTVKSARPCSDWIMPCSLFKSVLFICRSFCAAIIPCWFWIADCANSCSWSWL